MPEFDGAVFKESISYVQELDADTSFFLEFKKLQDFTKPQFQ